MPPLVRFMIMHAAVGFALAFVFVGAILAVDLSGLRSLMMASDMGWIALFMLTFFSGLTFASVQMGLAVMMMGEDEGGTPPGKRMGARLGVKIWRAVLAHLAPPPRRELAPIPVKHRNPPRR